MFNRFFIVILLGGVFFTPCLSQSKRTETERSMEKQGMVRIHALDPTIPVSLMYGRPDNFTGKVLYTDLREAYLHPQAAQALVKAQKELKRLRPDLSLKVYDAARPMSVQQKMWDVVKNTDHDFYVSNPARGGGLHNYGLAVDLTLCDARRDTLPMGTPIDYLGKQAHIDTEEQMVKRGTLSKEAYQNRLLLRKVMRKGGFTPLRTEWWHFNLKSRAEAKAHYKAIK